MFEIQCQEVLGGVVLYIDHELASPEQYQSFEIHFEQCPPCHQQMELERASISMIRGLLRQSCNERAPQELIERIQADLNLMAGTQFITQTIITQVITEVSIEIRHDYFEE